MRKAESVERRGRKQRRDIIATRAYRCCLAREGETSTECDPITSDRNLEDFILLLLVGRAAAHGQPRLFCLVWHVDELSELNIIS